MTIHSTRMRVTRALVSSAVIRHENNTIFNTNHIIKHSS